MKSILIASALAMTFSFHAFGFDPHATADESHASPHKHLSFTPHADADDIRNLVYEIVNGSPENPFPRHRTPTSATTESIGGYSGGCLAGGVELPPSGPGFYMMRPSRVRFFAHAIMSEFIFNFANRSKRNGFLVGDIAQPRGGPTNTMHVSHQTGLDVDVWYQRRNQYPPNLDSNWPERIGARSVVDGKTNTLNSFWDAQIEPHLLWVAAQADVERIFVHPVIKKHFCQNYQKNPHLNKIRPWYGHDDHFHVRLSCPAQDTDCENQAPVPNDPGCGAELDWWFSPDAQPPPPPSAPETFTLPERCRAVAESADWPARSPSH
jgi:penicillin-insensitive murein endopeptidase